ncbi:MAG: hypothetical protein OEZ59_06705 [Deltaproteobacteria bacterium]|nr:hypothetical protein [Deltaproteobacteria bacterium]
MELKPENIISPVWAGSGWLSIRGMVRAVLPVLFGVLVFSGVTPGQARGIELCSPESLELMRSVDISENQISTLCARARAANALLVVSHKRSEDELGYCRITIACLNNSTEYLNTMALNVEGGLFETFMFNNILPGAVGYASAKSKTLLACDEVLRMSFYWPVSLRIGDRSLNGRMLQHYKPLLMGSTLSWKE